MSTTLFLIGFLAFVVLLILASGIRKLKAEEEGLVEFLGAYRGKIIDSRYNFVFPLLERVVYVANSREKLLRLPGCKYVTDDDKEVEIEGTVRWRIWDLAKAYYRVENLPRSMANLSLSLLRAEASKRSKDDIALNPHAFNEALCEDLDNATDAWGIQILDVEFKLKK